MILGVLWWGFEDLFQFFNLFFEIIFCFHLLKHFPLVFELNLLFSQEFLFQISWRVVFQRKLCFLALATCFIFKLRVQFALWLFDLLLRLNVFNSVSLLLGMLLQLCKGLSVRKRTIQEFNLQNTFPTIWFCRFSFFQIYFWVFEFVIFN